GARRTIARSRARGCGAGAPENSSARASDQSALRTAVFIDVFLLFEFLELPDPPVVFFVVERDQRLAFTPQNEDAVLVHLGLEHVVGLTFDLYNVVDEIGFIFAGLFVDQLDGLNFTVRFRNLWHSASWSPTSPVVQVPLQQ